MKKWFNYKFALYASTFILFIQMWLNSGNLSVYAATLTQPHTMHGYITNYDDLHYEMNYKMIYGYPRSEWKDSFTLRRVGLFIVGLPFFIIFRFYWGGLITSFLLVLVTYLFFIRFLKNKYGIHAAYAGMLLASCYTGIMYWIGSPFAQNTIFPICVFTYMLMEVLNEELTRKQAAKYWLLIGLLFTGYDLFIVFLPAIFLFHLMEKKWVHALLSPIVILLPQLVVSLIIVFRGNEIRNQNTDLYPQILNSWVHNFSFADLWTHIQALPVIFKYNFMEAGFYVLPVVFLLFFLTGHLYFKFPMNRTERAIAMGIFSLWLFLNLTPTYQNHWQLRGIDIARIYQPVFILFIMYPVRFMAFLAQKHQAALRYYFTLLGLGFVSCFLLNIGGLYDSQLTQTMYYSFYRHSDADAYLKNIALFGKRPLGF